MHVVRNFRDDIRMEFGLDKSANIELKRGKLVQSQNLILDINRDIQELEQRKTFGIEKSEGIEQQQNEKKFEEGTHQEIKKDTELRVECLELNYSNWSIICSSINIQFWYYYLEERIRKMDRKTRKVLTMYEMHYLELIQVAYM